MAAPTVIKWTDSGAPTLSRVAESLISVLDYCLPQRGWTKEFSGTGKAVYRAGTGERKYYRILNDASVYYNASYLCTHAKITAYDSMTDVDTGAGQWDNGDEYIYVASGVVVARPWICIVDEKGFWIITCPLVDGTNSMDTKGIAVPHYIGETIPALPGQTARSIVAASQLGNRGSRCCSGCGTNAVATASTDYTRMSVNRSIDGATLKVLCHLIGGSLSTSLSGQSMAATKPFGHSTTTLRIYDYPYNGDLLYERPILNDTVAFSLGDYIPGLLAPCQNALSIPTFETVDSKLLMRTGCASTDLIASLTSATNGFGCMYIDISEGFRP